MAHQLTNNTTELENLLAKANALPVAITIDTTLTQEGQAADAKAVGDALAGKAANSHTQDASTITGGSFSGIVHAGYGMQTALDSLLRNSLLIPATMSPILTGEGEICWTYE